MLRAGCAGAALNVRINLGGLSDAGFVQQISQQYKDILQDAENRTREVLAAVDQTIGGN